MKNEILIKIDGLEDVIKPAIKWLQEHGNPHSIIVITNTHVDFYSSEIGIPVIQKESD